jgi:hypothetical protein
LTPTHHQRRWRPAEGKGLEHCEVHETADAVLIESVLIADLNGRRLGLSYRMVLGADWTFRSLDIRPAGAAPWHLGVDAAGSWSVDGRPAPELAGCIDIDLSGSPLTNTLPIRRVPFHIGIPQRFDMAWVDLSDLSVRRDGQIYTCLGNGKFLYQAADGGFSALLSFDDSGFVRAYPGLFEALPAS